MKLIDLEGLCSSLLKGIKKNQGESQGKSEDLSNRIINLLTEEIPNPGQRNNPPLPIELDALWGYASFLSSNKSSDKNLGFYLDQIKEFEKHAKEVSEFFVKMVNELNKFDASIGAQRKGLRLKINDIFTFQFPEGDEPLKSEIDETMKERIWAFTPKKFNAVVLKGKTTIGAFECNDKFGLAEVAKEVHKLLPKTA